MFAAFSDFILTLTCYLMLCSQEGEKRNCVKKPNSFFFLPHLEPQGWRGHPPRLRPVSSCGFLFWYEYAHAWNTTMTSLSEHALKK